jgi:hypothetical protein
MTGLFLDIQHLSCCATDNALEHIYKAHTGDGGDSAWLPHESILIRRLIELFSQRGLDRLASVQEEIAAWTLGHKHKPSPAPVAHPGMMTRWSADELELVRIYLEALPPAQWTIDDHMLAVDLVVQRYLPADELVAEAQWLSTRAAMMGKVQAHMAKPASVAQADLILAALPSTATAAAQQFALNPLEQAVMQFARVRCAENVRALSEDVRHRMKGTVLQHLEQQLDGAPGSSLQTKLLDQFGTLNRDWRRIAVTEAGEAQTMGLIASLPFGTKVKRVEQYASACNFCKRIDGVIATVVDPGKPDKDGETEIWVGKTNIGRSASPKKRVGDVLVARAPDEMWWLPAGLAHPHCRGRWVVVGDAAAPGDDPAFASWLKAALKS